jgi:HSF-type DNA-binding
MTMPFNERFDAAPSSSKRMSEGFFDHVGAKKARTVSAQDPSPSTPPREVLQPFPFYYYKDYSQVLDSDPLTPLTLPGRVPNFPAKMHAILSRLELQDIVCWISHGRSWKVIKPREFEVKVIPTYFEHAKFSSFIRQANGWGFRRITSGRDRNSYYHPQFLRGLPHLCKDMKRLGVAQKQPADPDHEPNLFKISEMFPVPERPEDDSIMLHSTIENGPRARMSIESILPHRAVAYGGGGKLQTLLPHEQESIVAFQHSLGVTKPFAAVPMETSPGNDATAKPPGSFTPVPSMYALAAANQMAFASGNPFAAGFATAVAMNEQQLFGMMVPPNYFQPNTNNNNQMETSTTN